MRENRNKACSFHLEEHHFLWLRSEEIKVVLGKSEKYEKGKKMPSVVFYFNQASFHYLCFIFKLT